MARGLDHVIHAVRDLDAAAEFYERLGFTVGVRNRHPWGTHNRLVQFPNFFLEILTVAEPEKLPPRGDKTNLFARLNDEFLRSVGEGFTGMVTEGLESEKEHAVLARAGFGGIPLFHFSRKGKRADGRETEVGFDIAFANDPASPHGLFFICKQTHPENFWSPELQHHANGARAVSACAVVAENPTDHYVLLETLTGVRDPHSSSLGLVFRTPRGVVLALNPRGFTDTYGVEPPIDRGLRVGALVFKASDLAATRTFLERNRVSVRERRGKLVVSGGAARGAVIVFET